MGACNTSPLVLSISKNVSLLFELVNTRPDPALKPRAPPEAAPPGKYFLNDPDGVCVLFLLVFFNASYPT